MYEPGQETLASLVEKAYGAKQGAPITTLLMQTYNTKLFGELVGLLDCEPGYDLLAEVFLAWKNRFTSFPYTLDEGMEYLEDTTDNLRNQMKNYSVLNKSFLNVVQNVHDKAERTEEDLERLDSACFYLSWWGLKGNKEALLLRLDIQPDEAYLDIIQKRYGNEAYEEALEIYNQRRDKNGSEHS